MESPCHIRSLRCGGCWRGRLTYRYVELVAGVHPLNLFAHGFRGTTVPAMKLPDGRRVQGSLAIARALEELIPTPSLYPSEPAARAAAQDAERWGEAVLQPISRRLIRWGLRQPVAAHPAQAPAGRKPLAEAGDPADPRTAIAASPIPEPKRGRDKTSPARWPSFGLKAGRAAIHTEVGHPRPAASRLASGSGRFALPPLPALSTRVPMSPSRSATICPQ
jgi:hypothetical protein